MLETFTTDIASATVTFVEGAQISNVTLPIDSSSIQVSNLPVGAHPQAVVALLAGVGVTIAEHDICVRSISPSGSHAVVKLDDPESARLVVSKLNNTTDNDSGGQSVTLLPNVPKYGPQLDMTSVSCVWYRPARMATLYFTDFIRAYSALVLLQSNPELLGRRFTATGPEPHGNRLLVHLTGLHPHTERQHVEALFNTIDRPVSTVMQNPSSDLTDIASSQHVEHLLHDVGGLLYFGPRGATPDGRSLQAIATFDTYASALRAVDKLHNKRFEVLDNARLLLSRSLAITRLISSHIAEAIKSQLDTLSLEAKDAHNTLFEISDIEEQPFKKIRIRGEAETSLAHVYTALEKLTSGEVIMNSQSPLWNPWFSKSDGLECINTIAMKNNVYIYRDHRKAQLRLVGGTPDLKTAIEQALLVAVRSATRTTHCIRLTLDQCSKIAGEGFGVWEDLSETFSKDVQFDVDAGHPAIFLHGSAEELEVACSIIMKWDAPAQPAECVVCWWPASDPLKLSCGHSYCRDCLYHAADTAALNLPLACLGDSGECNHHLGIQELIHLLPYVRFEKLLSDVFEAYIRTHPNELRYCPTPDCSSVYRPGENGALLTCLKCLNRTCTSCHVHEHVGISCAEWQEFHADGGQRALEQYRRRHNVRDCPKCRVPIEKDGGCMHVRCVSCQTHICWVCLRFFDGGSDACYAHITAEHSAIYEPANPNNAAFDQLNDGYGWLRQILANRLPQAPLEDRVDGAEARQRMMARLVFVLRQRQLEQEQAPGGENVDGVGQGVNGVAEDVAEDVAEAGDGEEVRDRLQRVMMALGRMMQHP